MKITQEMIGRAVDLITPLATTLIQESGKQAIAVMVMAGEYDTHDSESCPTVYKNDICPVFRGDISQQNQPEKIQKYRDIAEGKAKICWRTGYTSGTVVKSMSILIKDGDAKYQGGSVETFGYDNFRIRIAVGISGLESYRDEYLSDILIRTILMLADQRLAESPEKIPGIFSE